MKTEISTAAIIAIVVLIAMVVWLTSYRPQPPRKHTQQRGGADLHLVEVA